MLCQQCYRKSIIMPNNSVVCEGVAWCSGVGAAARQAVLLLPLIQQLQHKLRDVGVWSHWVSCTKHFHGNKFLNFCFILSFTREFSEHFFVVDNNLRLSSGPLVELK